MTDRDRDRIQSAIRHIQTAVDVDQWAADIAVEAMQEKISREPSEDVRCSVFPNSSDCISRQAALDEGDEWIDTFDGDGDTDIRRALRLFKGGLKRLPSAGHESYAKDRYEDLCEYFGNNEKTIRAILHDRKEFKEWLERMKWHVVECDRLGRIIEKVKRAQRQWVPCSERLPAEGGHYIVTVHPDYVPENVEHIDMTYFKDGRWLWVWGDEFEEYPMPIVAWMPVPEPYAEETK